MFAEFSVFRTKHSYTLHKRLTKKSFEFSSINCRVRRLSTVFGGQKRIEERIKLLAALKIRIPTTTKFIHRESSGTDTLSNATELLGMVQTTESFHYSVGIKSVLD